jgi:hypothetical protein
MQENTTGLNNTASGYEALFFNVAGSYNTAAGGAALRTSTGDYNTAVGESALRGVTSGDRNTAVGYRAGYAATTGVDNLFIGAGVLGVAADTNTMRIGLPYNSGTGEGQNRTFISGIYDTQLTGTAHAVFIDQFGQLGTVVPGILSGTGTAGSLALEQQKAQAAVNDELRARIARLDAANAELRIQLAALQRLVARPAARR